jgi:cell division protein FtsL
MSDGIASNPILAGKAIDNSRIVREVDPRSSRDLLVLLAVVLVLVAGFVLYAWPHLQVRQTSREAELLSRERERLIEQNRKLRLEKAALEDLRRVEAIATRELGMASPPPERLIVVERGDAAPDASRVASSSPVPAAEASRNGGAQPR